MPETWRERKWLAAASLQSTAISRQPTAKSQQLASEGLRPLAGSRMRAIKPLRISVGLGWALHPFALFFEGHEAFSEVAKLRRGKFWLRLEGHSPDRDSGGEGIPFRKESPQLCSENGHSHLGWLVWNLPQCSSERRKRRGGVGCSAHSA